MRWLRACLVLLFMALLSGQSAYSRDDADQCILQDEEVEEFLQDIVKRIAQALNFRDEVHVYVLCSRVLNAAATGDGSIVVNAGAILQCTDVREFIAIIAHEIGHLEGRHIITLQSHIDHCQKTGLAMMVLGAAAAAVSGNPAVLVAGMGGGQSIAYGMMLSKLRQKEALADTKAAQAMEILHWPIFQHFVALHEKLEMNTGGVYNVYMSTHPAPEDRKAKFAKWARESEGWKSSPQTVALLETWQRRFKRVQAKINAMTQPVNDALTATANPRDVNARYARAIALYRAGRYRESHTIIDALLTDTAAREDPNYEAYYTEIKAMCMIKMKQCKQAAEVCWPILKPGTGKVHIDLGLIYAEAVIEGALRDHFKNAIGIVIKIKALRPAFSSVTHVLGQLYTLDGQPSKASLCSAEVAMASGDLDRAEWHAKKATPSIQAKDIKADIERQKAQAAH
ncbi:MAG: M48 family metalloprotease [Holosporales bacterium]|jgi:predicted Zn-dependent protease|nr:M48 family metalloprotease [Holosporales bacterium]